MCGISGFLSFSRNTTISKKSFVSLTNLLEHRGPDDYAYFLENLSLNTHDLFKHESNSPLQEAHIALGHRRLSIIDLSESGRQPLISQDQRFVMAFNGEIYNYVELREELIGLGNNFTTNGDSEVVLRSFEQWGTACFAKMNGMWSTAIYDRHEKKLFLSRDRYGKKPLYFYQDSNKIIFASEIKSILSADGVPKKVNTSKLLNYTARHYRYVDNDTDSFFEGIQQIPKSSTVEIDHTGHTTQSAYWNPSDFLNQEEITDEKQATEELLYLLEDAVKIRMRSDVPVGALLSGGMDSSSIVALACKMNPDFRTISGVTGDGYYDETEYIKAIVDHTGVDSSFIYPKPTELFPTVREMLTFHDEPICTITWYSMYLMVRQTSKYDLKVMLTGHGGDELLAGYWDHYQYHYHDLREAGKQELEQNELQAWSNNYGRPMEEYTSFGQKISKGVSERSFEVDKFSNYLNCIQSPFRNHESVLSTVHNFETKNELSRRLYLESFYETIPASLRAEDRNFMAFGIENRVPFLDYRLAEFCMRLSNDLKIKNGFGKYLLRSATNNLLPEKVRWRKDKVGHNVPADDWYRNENKQEILELIDRDNFLNNEFFDRDQLKRTFQKHIDGENHHMFLWQYINAQLWHEQFFV